MSHLTNKLKEKLRKYLRRKIKVNSKIKSQKHENRLIVNKSNLYVSAQLINADGKILAIISDKKAKGKSKTERALAAGEAMAKLIKAQKIDSIVFDRNGYLYHGRVKAFADGIRK
jgi:large subunit ribosomal protein L18